MSRGCQKEMMWIGLAGVMVLTAVGVQGARADAFTDYGLAETFNLPDEASVFDVLGDGRLITLVGTDVYAETTIGSRSFDSLGTLAGADFNSYGAAFLRVSPDGTRIAIGNSGGALYDNYQVGVFSLIALAGDWFDVNHYDAEWIDDTDLALTAGVFGDPSIVTALDTTITTGGPVNPTVIENIGGSSSGITFDAAGNLYTGNGYDGAGDSDTGWIKAFAPAEWKPDLTGGTPANFETGGTLIADLLSAASLGFDAEGNLHVGGGDYLGGAEQDNAALVRYSAVDDALAGEPVDTTNPLDVRRFDPDSDSSFNYYDVNYNNFTGELYVREGATVYSYVVPEPTALLLVLAGVTAVGRRRLSLLRQVGGLQ